jgi:hypothetical protein
MVPSVLTPQVWYAPALTEAKVPADGDADVLHAVAAARIAIPSRRITGFLSL